MIAEAEAREYLPPEKRYPLAMILKPRARNYSRVRRELTDSAVLILLIAFTLLIAFLIWL